MKRILYANENNVEKEVSQPYQVFYINVVSTNQYGDNRCKLFAQFDYEYNLNTNQLILKFNYGNKDTTGNFTVAKPNYTMSVKINNREIISDVFHVNNNASKTKTEYITCKLDGSTDLLNVYVSINDGEVIRDEQHTIYLKKMFSFKLKIAILWNTVSTWIKTIIGWKRCIIWKKINGIWKRGK